MQKFKCTKDEKRLNYIDVFITRDGVNYKFKTLVRTGSERTIFSAQELNVDVSKLKKTQAIVGYENVDIYEIDINSIAIGDIFEGDLYGVDSIYVSDAEYFKETPVLGMDYLSMMSFSNSLQEGMSLVFDAGEVAKMITEKKENNI